MGGEPPAPPGPKPLLLSRLEVRLPTTWSPACNSGDCTVVHSPCTLPGVTTTGAVVPPCTTITIVVLKVFDIIFAMTNGQWDTEVLANFMFKWMFVNFDYGRGSTIAVIIMLAVLPIMVWNIRRANAEEGTR